MCRSPWVRRAPPSSVIVLGHPISVVRIGTSMTGKGTRLAEL